MIIYAVTRKEYSGAWYEDIQYDKFFKTKEKAELRLKALNKKNKSKYIEFGISEINVGE